MKFLPGDMVRRLNSLEAIAGIIIESSSGSGVVHVLWSNQRIEKRSTFWLRKLFNDEGYEW